MENATMLYKSPGEHLTDGVSYGYVIVDEPEVEAKVAEGWSLTVAEAGQAAQDRAAAQLKANEDEQARIAAELDAQAKAGSAALKAVHKGAGRWSLVDAAGTEVETGLSKEEAQAKAGEKAGG